MYLGGRKSLEADFSPGPSSPYQRRASGSLNGMTPYGSLGGMTSGSLSPSGFLPEIALQQVRGGRDLIRCEGYHQG